MTPAADIRNYLGFMVALLPRDLGRSKVRQKFSRIFSKTREINWLLAARFFLFCSRDVWFVVALPVFLYDRLGWGFSEVGGFLALWVIGYGLVQAAAPRFIRGRERGSAPDGVAARRLAWLLAVVPAAIGSGLAAGWVPGPVLVVGLGIFGVLSGWAYQVWGLTGCLAFSSGFLVLAALLSYALPRGQTLSPPHSAA